MKKNWKLILANIVVVALSFALTWAILDMATAPLDEPGKTLGEQIGEPLVGSSIGAKAGIEVGSRILRVMKP